MLDVGERAAGDRDGAGPYTGVRQHSDDVRGDECGVGLVRVLQREDETGLLDLVVKPDVYERFKPLLRHQPFILVEGVVQRANNVVNVVVTRALEFNSFAGPPPQENGRVMRAREEYTPGSYS